MDLHNIQIDVALIALLSALIGAFVSSVVSGLMTMFGQYLERKSRQRELLLVKAIELAVERRKLIVETAEKEGLPASLVPDIYTAAEHMTWLEHILREEHLPPNIKKEIEKDIQEVDREIDRFLVI
jgi:hypothetical protein